MSVSGNSQALGDNRFFENIRFRGDVDQTLAQADPSIGSVRIRAALDHVDVNRLSTTERSVLLAHLDVLSGDGAISNADADLITDLVDRFSATGPLQDVLHDAAFSALGGASSFLPFSMAGLAAYTGSALFGATLGVLVDRTVQTFKDTLFLASANSMIDGCAKSTYGGDKVARALENADLSRLNPAERAKLLSMIGFAAADGRIGLVDARAICDYLEQAQGLSAASGASGEWTVDRSSDGKATIDLGNYTLTLNEHNSEFVLTNKDSGERTRIWGDPHFEHNGSRVGDFYGTTTLNLADGTKITINTTPWEAGNNGMTLSSTLTITQGDRVMRVTGLDQNRIGDLDIQQLPFTGRLVDAAVDDGTNIYENPEGGPWMRLDNGGWLTPIDGEFLSRIV